MNKLVIIIFILLLTGCVEPYSAGVLTGAAAMKKLSVDAQANFRTALNELEAETQKIKDAVVISPKTLEAISEAKTMKNDPVAWTALVSLLAASGLTGNLFGNRKKPNVV